MTKTALICKAIRPVRIDRTRSEARLVDAIVTWMGRLLRRSVRLQFAVEQQGGPVCMPQAVARMDQYAEWRRTEPFGSHCPLLKWLKWPVIGHHRPRSGLSGHLVDNEARPAIERVRRNGILTHSPSLEMRPERSPDIADQQQCSRGPAGCSGRRILATAEIEASTKAQAMFGKPRGDHVSVALRPYGKHSARLPCV